MVICVKQNLPRGSPVLMEKAGCHGLESKGEIGSATGKGTWTVLAKASRTESRLV